jgi:hypothetical protein
MRATAIPVLLCLPLWSLGQDMTLVSGNLYVAEGTRMAIDGPVVWTIEPAASVVNDGLIEFGTGAILVEPDGGPITGVGTETAQRALPTPFTGVEPGGLGLVMGANTGIGALTLTRGHLPFATADGDESIARWFRIEADGSVGTWLDLEMRYDATELNGLLPADLLMHRTLELGTYWMPLAGGPGAGSVTAVDQAPWGWITAFDSDATTAIAEELPRDGFDVYPTLATDRVHVLPKGDAVLRQVELLDAQGRLLATHSADGQGGRLVLDLSSHASGTFLLRVNGWHVTRLMKP